MSNLILNAIEATLLSKTESDSPDKSDSEVRLKLFPGGPESVILEVADTGPGPEAAIVNKMFEPLVTAKKDGTGLGLFVAREIVQNHGGQLHWERRGQQTCFIVELPVIQVENTCVEITDR